MPLEWGTSCLAWEDGDSDRHSVGAKPDCAALWPTLTHGEWCCKPWCYVNKATCNLPSFESLVKPGAGQLYYSYDACAVVTTKYTAETCPWQGRRITEQGCECTGTTWPAPTLAAKGMPPEWGTTCRAWEDGDCSAHPCGANTDCDALWPTVTRGQWCCRPWCYVPATCSLPTFMSGIDDGGGLYYSYEACMVDAGITSASTQTYTDATCKWTDTSADFNDALQLCRRLGGGAGGQELLLLQDLSGSYGDDLVTMNKAMRGIGVDLSSQFGRIRFGIASYIDKGDGSCFKIEQPVTSNWQRVESVMAGLSASGGGSMPEAQLEALVGVAAHCAEVGFTPGRKKIVILTTDATWHQAGDGYADSSERNSLDGSHAACVGQDYPSIADVKAKLTEADITPIFLVTENVMSEYEQLVKQLGMGSVIELAADSSDLSPGLRTGVCALGNLPEVTAHLRLGGATKAAFASRTRGEVAVEVARAAGSEYGLVTTVTESPRGLDVTFVVLFADNAAVDPGLAQLTEAVDGGALQEAVRGVAGMAQVTVTYAWGSASDSVTHKLLTETGTSSGASSGTCACGSSQRFACDPNWADDPVGLFPGTSASGAGAVSTACLTMASLQMVSLLLSVAAPVFTSQ